MKIAHALFAATVIGTAVPAFAQIAGPGTGNGALTFIGYDDVTKHSLIESLGLNLAQVQPGTIDAAFPADGNYVLSGFSSAFGANTANLRWMIVAGDVTATSGFNNVSLATTSLSLPASQNNVGLRNGLNNLEAMIGFANSGCSNALACVATSGTDSQYAGVLSTSLNVPTDPIAPGVSFDTTGGINDSLGFYLLSGTGNGQQTQVGKQTYAGLFTLGTNGVVNWASSGIPSVPLPAAVWLLMSGLVSMVTVSRRRTAVAA